MDTPPDQPPDKQLQNKQLRVSADTHRRVHNIAAKFQGTADDAIRYLLGQDVVRVPVTDRQRERWTAAAEAAGVPLPEFIAMRVEAAISFGSDPAYAMSQLWEILARIDKNTRPKKGSPHG